MTTLIQERYKLVTERLEEIRTEGFSLLALRTYFRTSAEFLLRLDETRRKLLEERGKGAGEEGLFRLCADLLADLLPGAYEGSYANPVYVKAVLQGGAGERGMKASFPAGAGAADYAKLLGALYFEEKTRAAAVYENRLEDLLIHMELFVEVYTAFLYEWEENGLLPDWESLRQILYWFTWDYSEAAAERLTLRMAEAPRADLLVSCERHGFLEDGCPWEGFWEDPEPLKKVFLDHEADRAFLWDGNLAGRRLEIYRSLFEAGKGKTLPGREDAWTEKEFRRPSWEVLDAGKRRLWDKYWRKMEELCKEFAVFPGNV